MGSPLRRLCHLAGRRPAPSVPLPRMRSSHPGRLSPAGVPNSHKPDLRDGKGRQSCRVLRRHKLEVVPGQRRPDRLGQVLVIVLLASLTYAIIEGGCRKFPQPSLSTRVLGLPLGADVPNDLSQIFRSRIRKGDEPVMHDPQQRQVSRGGRQRDVFGGKPERVVGSLCECAAGLSRPAARWLGRRSRVPREALVHPQGPWLPQPR